MSYSATPKRKMDDDIFSSSQSKVAKHEATWSTTELQPEPPKFKASESITISKKWNLDDQLRVYATMDGIPKLLITAAPINEIFDPLSDSPDFFGIEHSQLQL